MATNCISSITLRYCSAIHHSCAWRRSDTDPPGNNCHEAHMFGQLAGFIALVWLEPRQNNWNNFSAQVCESGALRGGGIVLMAKVKVWQLTFTQLDITRLVVHSFRLNFDCATFKKCRQCRSPDDSNRPTAYRVELLSIDGCKDAQ